MVSHQLMDDSHILTIAAPLGRAARRENSSRDQQAGSGSSFQVLSYSKVAGDVADAQSTTDRTSGESAHPKRLTLPGQVQWMGFSSRQLHTFTAV
jgi:hypothetical protein